MMMIRSANTKFWIYNLTTKNYQEFIKIKTQSNNQYINFFEYQNPIIKKHDIILLFIKDKDPGFIGIIQVGETVHDNKGKIVIFKDNNLNNYTAKVNFKIMFDNVVKVPIILSNLHSKNVGFKNVSSFSSKFFKKVNTACLLEHHGREIMEHLFIICHAKTVEKSINNIPEIKLDSKKIKYNQIIKEENKSDEEDENEEDEEEDQHDKNGYIPIMVIPCPEYNFNYNNPSKYFLNHYKHCNDCIITNNNNRELCSIMDDKTTVEYEHIKEKKNSCLDISIEAYFNLRKYEPYENKNYPLIKIMYIDNEHEIYDGCIIVAWCDIQD
jgi:hypothetical protein